MDARRVQLDLPRDASAPRSARRFVTTVLGGWGVRAAVAERAQLLTSELVSNAVMHGAGGIELSVLEVGAQRNKVRIEVCNDGPGTPVMRQPQREALSGRGLRLVDDLSLEWGSRTLSGQTLVWFELPLN